MDKNMKLGFSLIELSIVLIIIGLLVAGITGGTSLIKSAKLQSTTTDMNNLKTAFITFYSLNYRVPGDLDNSGCIGYCYSDTLNSKSYKTFGGEYSGLTVNYFAAPFVDLYLQGLVDFKPDPNTVNQAGDATLAGKRTPIVKGLDNAMFNDFHTFDLYPPGGGRASNNSFYNMRNGYHQRIIRYGDNTYLDPRTVYKLDQKLDDGSPNSGIFRSGCGTTTGAGVDYPTLIKNNAQCINVWYHVMDI